MKRILLVLAIASPVVACLAPGSAHAATRAMVAVPMHHVGPVTNLSGHVGASTSTNWAGYAALEGSKQFTKVSGKWTQPAVDCSKTPNTYSVFWVGLDGYSSPTVEQDGSEADCVGTTAVYTVWWEMYPTNSIQTVFSINAGDAIVAKVTYKGGTFTMTVKDKTSGRHFTQRAGCSTCQRSSAEWIAEAPSAGPVLPLADFGTVHFAASKAGVQGHSGTITDPNWTYDQITMVSSKNHSKVKAQPGSLDPSGQAFDVTWMAKT